MNPTADHLAARIVQLGGEPDFAPDNLSERSHAEYVSAGALPDMIRENLVAERPDHRQKLVSQLLRFFLLVLVGSF